MKAIVYHEYGPPDVLHLSEVETPVPEDDQVLVKVRAAASNPYDWHFLRGEPYFIRLLTGLRKPKRSTLGADFSGEVVAVGSEVKEFKPGDAVFGLRDGAFAEYVACPAEHLALKPASLSFEEAAGVPMAGLTALQGLRDVGEVKAGENVLILGASGGVGTFAVQLACGMGAHVTGVCSTPNLDMVRALGASDVIDYTEEDYADREGQYDVIFQLGGMDSPTHCRRALKPKGRLVMSSGESEGKWIGPMGQLLKAAIINPFVGQSLISLGTKRSGTDLAYLAQLIDDGKLKPVIDHILPLAKTAEAIRYVEKGHSKGKVIVAI